MEIKKTRNNGATKLVLCFAGWSATPEAFGHLEAGEDTDVWICYDYRDLSFTGELDRYRQIDLVAWSLGVWVAANVISPETVLHSATAINGTGLPIDDTYGIPTVIFRGTLENVNNEGMNRFNRRMCGSRELLATYQHFPARPATELKEELLNLYNNISRDNHPGGIDWTKAFVSTHDMIFPTGNQRNYWQGLCPFTEIDAPHYPFKVWKQWKEITNR